MKEKEMIKKMYEEQHGSKALELSADEILNANLTHGARVKSRGIIGAAAAAAAVLAVGVGVFALNNSSIETSPGESTSAAGQQNTTLSRSELSVTDTQSRVIYDGARIPGEKTYSPTTFTPLSVEEIRNGDNTNKVLINVFGSESSDPKDTIFSVEGGAVDRLNDLYSEYLSGKYEPVVKGHIDEDSPELSGDVLEANDSFEEIRAQSKSVSASFYDENGQHVVFYALLSCTENKAAIKIFEDVEHNKYSVALFNDDSQVFKALRDIYFEYENYFADLNSWDRSRGDLDKGYVTLTNYIGEDKNTVLCNHFTLKCKVASWYYSFSQAPSSQIDKDYSGEDSKVLKGKQLCIGFYDKNINRIVYIYKDADKYPVRVVYCTQDGEPVEGETYYIDLYSSNNKDLLYAVEIAAHSEYFEYSLPAEPIQKSTKTEPDPDRPATAATTTVPKAEPETTTTTTSPKTKPESTTTTVTSDPKDEYSANEIKPISGEINIDLGDNATVRFTRSISKEFPQADMTFWLISEYTDRIKGIYYEYKEGQIKPADSITLEDDPSQLTGGTWMSIAFKNKDGEVIYIEGVDINEQKAYVRLTDGAEECVTGKVFYFDQGSEMYKMLREIWDFYYDIYENTDSLPS